MKSEKSLHPVLALFQKRVDGDDALLRLARLRFEEAGLGVECYAETPEELRRLLGFRPPGAPAAVHLGRGLDLFSREGRRLVLEFAGEFRGEVLGMVVHDQPEIEGRLDDYLRAVRRVEKEIGDGPRLFIEYAAHLDRGLYLEIFRGLRDAPGVGACIDIGHMGLKRAGEAFLEMHPGEDVFHLSDGRLVEAVDDVQAAVKTALPAVVEAMREIGGMGIPLHLHLHDGHPLAGRVLGGLSDHYGFLETVSVYSERTGRRSLPMMYGLRGLKEIISAALGSSGPVSLSLEIHETGGRLPLAGEAAGVFSGWSDLANAERMNHWLGELRKNHLLVLDALGAGP